MKNINKNQFIESSVKIIFVVIVGYLVFSKYNFSTEVAHTLNATKNYYPKHLEFNFINHIRIGIVGFGLTFSLVFGFIFLFNRQRKVSLWFMVFLFFIAVSYLNDLVALNIYDSNSFLVFCLGFSGTTFCLISVNYIVFDLFGSPLPHSIKRLNKILLFLFIVGVCIFYSEFTILKNLIYLSYATCFFFIEIEAIKGFYEAYRKNFVSKFMLIIGTLIGGVSLTYALPDRFINHSTFMFFTDAILPFLILLFTSYLIAKTYSELREGNLELRKLLLEKQIILENHNEFLETQIKIKTAELQQTNAAKDQLFSIISHDLRSPIASLKSILQLFDNQQINQEEFRQLSKQLMEGVDNVQKMLENLLEWSFIQIKGSKPDLKNIEILQIIEQVVEQFRDFANKKNIKIEILKVEKTILYADENQLKIIFRNLINNALKFTNNGGIVSLRTTTNNNEIIVEISDNGVGIDSENIKNIFSNPKINSGTNGEKGTGLGLILCKELIVQNGGNILVQSNSFEGTTFKLRFPNKIKAAK